ncbi:transposase [Paenibacillus periandrae]|uniref:transposase n=1 Tax=Paenibacillus periandrae TaxID=1761741 RepID=UPI001F08D3A5|nr:transposase [Paenibacillus periandrae]
MDGKTALAFFEQFPAPHHLADYTVQELREFLQKPSNYACSMKSAEKILRLIHEDGATKREYQEERDFIIQSHIRRIRSCKTELEAIEGRLAVVMKETGYRLETMYGIDVVTAASFVAEIGHIGRFKHADSLACFAGIAPILVGSGDSHRHYKCKQGNRELHELFYRLACRQIGAKRGSREPNHPYYYEYYQAKLAAGKTKKQSIICIMRKLVNVVYAMMRNKTGYVKPDTQVG